VSSPRERYRPTVRALAEDVRERQGGLAAHLVVRAYEHAAGCHDGRERLNGDPFLAHSIAVAKIVVRLTPGTGVRSWGPTSFAPGSVAT
jgi:(p)ppGpp synthase/HD superfamily hydrolase